MRNSIEWIDDCLESILNQTAIGTISLEVCVYDDVSTDGSYLKLESWKKTFETEGIPMKLSRNTELEPGGGKVLLIFTQINLKSHLYLRCLVL